MLDLSKSVNFLSSCRHTADDLATELARAKFTRVDIDISKESTLRAMMLIKCIVLSNYPVVSDEYSITVQLLISP